MWRWCEAQFIMATAVDVCRLPPVFLHTGISRAFNFASMADYASDSDSDDMSEGERAATDRLAPKTQKDYSSYINQLTTFACHPSRREMYSDCLNGNAVVMPVPLKLGKAFVCYLRDKKISWPMDGRPEENRTYLKRYSVAKINSACLAIKNTFRTLSQPVPQADASFYLDFCQAYVQLIARDKSIGAHPAVEGSIALGSAQIKKVIDAAFRLVHSIRHHHTPSSIATTHQSTPYYTTVYHITPLHSTLHLNIPPYTTVHHPLSPPPPSVHHLTPSYTTIHIRTPSCTPPFTTRLGMYLKARAGLNRLWRNCGFSY